MNKNEVEAHIEQIEKSFKNGDITKNETIERIKEVNRMTKKSNKMTKNEKKEIAHKIIKIILEVLLQIITIGIPAIISGGKTILKHK